MCWSTQKGCVVIVFLSFLATCVMAATTAAPNTVDACVNVTCENNGTCMNGTGNCSCTDGWLGPTCQTEDYCHTASCANGGVCILGPSNYTCNCTSGWTGWLCDEDVDDCLTTPCKNNGSCSDAGTNNFTCSCTQGWLEPTCENDVDDCLTTPCKNNGNCSDAGTNNFTCSCTQGWLGPTCEDEDYCHTASCANGGVCILGPSNYTCNCTSGWTGWLCDEDVDDCLTTPCKNNGSCSDAGTNNFTCSCTQGWLGPTCENVDYCFGASCTNNATCVLGADNYTCSCQPGWTGWLCDVDVDDCESTPCKNSGNCTDTGTNNYTCSCGTGWTGDTCETDVKECETDPCVNGTCQEGPGNFTCVCDADYQGTLCDEVIDDCLASPCSHSGTCVDGIGNYTCNCTDHWTGRNCTEDVDECSASLCKNGYCQNTIGNYTCYCNNGWEGQECSVDINECNGSPCNNVSEVCTNTNGSHSCDCKPGYQWRGNSCIETLLFDSSQGVSGDREIYGPYFAPGGLPYFGKRYVALYVSRDGYILLDQYRSLKNPALNASDWPTDVTVVAPYWSHWDVPAEGAALYVSEYMQYQPDKTNTLGAIQDVISKKLSENIAIEYALVVTWADVIPYPANQYKGFQNVTFQGVLATNGQKTYALFVYDGLNLADDSTVVISRGYSTQAAPSLLSPVATGSRSREVYRMFNDSGTLPTNMNYQCLDQLEEIPAPNPAYLYVRNKCPCTRKQALLDKRYIYNDTDNCAILRFDPARGTCCYDQVYGTLLSNERGAGYPRSSNTTVAGYIDMVNSICCSPSSQVCKVFYAKYPSDTCASYTDVTTGYYGGGLVSKLQPAGPPYIFNGIGEYVLFGDSSKGAVIQGRMERVADNINVTALTAVAIQVNNVIVEARLGAGKNTVEFYHKGVMLQNSSEMEEFMLDGDTIIFQYGSYVQVTASGQLLVSVFVPHTENVIFNAGLVAIMARDTVTQELVDAAKVTIESDSHFNYSLATGNFSSILAQSITPLSYSNFTVYRDSLYSSNATAIATANTTCGDDVACLVSYKALSDASVAAGLRAKMEDIKDQETTLNMKPPIFSGLPQIWNVTEGDFSLVVKATNDSGATYSVTPSEDQALYSYNETTGEFTWNVTSALTTTKTTFQFLASAGLNATYTPAVAVCLCAESSQCDYNIINYEEKRTSELFGQALCRCPENTKGDYCDQSKPVCHGQCFHGATCNESRADNPCTCPNGLEGDGIKCYDKNECVDNVCGDHAVCNNLLGNYSCSCMQGYQRQDNKCVDINECKANTCPGYTDSLRQFCENTDGGCKWSCRPTFKGRYCTQKATYTFGGEIVFAQVPGRDQVWTADLMNKNSEAFKKLAEKVEKVLKEVMQKKVQNATVTVTEFVLVQGTTGSRRRRQADSGQIEAKYEVGTNTPTTSATLQDALNDGFTSCSTATSCPLGTGSDMLIGVDKQKTKLTADYDLCGSDTNNNCNAASTVCTSGNGTFECKCRPGFKEWPLHDNACEDINECTNMTAACGGKGTNCTNLLGTYTCTCEMGYYWTNPTDKCQNKCNEAPCENGGSCINTPGEDPGYACKCPSGWVGSTCGDKDPEAERKRIIIIAVSACLGGLCFLLLVALCCVCRKKNPPSKNRGKSFDVLDDSDDYMAETRIPRPQVRRHSDNLEMERQASFNKHTKFDKDQSDPRSYVNQGYRKENGADEDRNERL
ncbi:neurogenic locus notch homolog protein 1-like isoform X2 [Haliotis rufescens]|uniref:neurogenic locus notch homolog protein 1-like isoform X2 n=1 Tax=Haliotis rufescens TaxID=6454 RepID=UPI00201EDF2F|nr:neurogenic locus notch homolog protein 1-like isoform X2 [Haliotis rufescens]